jgi:hypothetical protein
LTSNDSNGGQSNLFSIQDLSQLVIGIQQRTDALIDKAVVRGNLGHWIGDEVQTQ